MGGLGLALAGKVPEGFEQSVERTPRLRDSAKDWRTTNDAWPGRFRGWDWLCPGRTIVDGTPAGWHVSCGRVCKKLWLPLQVWTIGNALGERAGAAWGHMPKLEQGGRDLACARCWGLRFDNDASEPAEAWNRFVSAVSGGAVVQPGGRPPGGVGGGVSGGVADLAAVIRVFMIHFFGLLHFCGLMRQV